MVAKKTARPKTFTRKKPATSPAKQIKKQLTKQEEMLEEIKTLIEHEPKSKPSEIVSVESKTISTIKEEIKPVVEEPQEKKVAESDSVSEKEEATSTSNVADANVAKANKETEPEDVTESKEKEESKENEGSGTSKKRFWINLVIIFIGTVIIVTFFLFLRQQKIDEMNKQEQVNIPKPTKAVTPTPKEIDVSTYSIDILNGSGVAGAAAKAKTLLTDKSYNVTSTGNADTSNYAKTIIKVKKSVPSAYTEALKNLLLPTYALDTVATLADTETTDVVIIIGSQTPQ